MKIWNRDKQAMLRICSFLALAALSVAFFFGSSSASAGAVVLFLTPQCMQLKQLNEFNEVSSIDPYTFANI